MPASDRANITLPLPRFQQLGAIAERRGLPNATAVIEAWIARAVEEGEIPASPPGFMAFRDDDGFLIQLCGHDLPLVKPDRARLLAAVLSAAAGEVDPELPMEFPAGRPVVLDLGEFGLVVGKAGRGIRFIVKAKGAAEGEGVQLATSPAFVAGLAREIRAEFANAAA